VSSCWPPNLYATLNTFRQYWRTMASHACWSPARQRLISASIASGGGPEYEDAVGESDDMRLVVSRLGILSGPLRCRGPKTHVARDRERYRFSVRVRVE